MIELVCMLEQEEIEYQRANRNFRALASSRNWVMMVKERKPGMSNTKPFCDMSHKKRMHTIEMSSGLPIPKRPAMRDRTGRTSSTNRLSENGSNVGREFAWSTVMEDMKARRASLDCLLNWVAKVSSLKLIYVSLAGKQRACLITSGEREKTLFP